MPGRQNVVNALAVIALADHLGVELPALTKDLREFQGVGRRFQLAGHIQKQGIEVPVIDDYGHAAALDVS